MTTSIPPSRIGEYEILERLGRGGMGLVYRARQRSLDRIVALKVLRPDRSLEKDPKERFLREARATARLNHPHIVAGIDVGEADGCVYFAMEFIDGESLQQLLAREGVLPEKRAVEVGLAIASALAHAHAVGILHRDVKPDNILLDRQGVPKLTDLGLAKRSQEEDFSLTQENLTVGSPHYMSPEQARGKRDLDGRTDIYSLGCTLFHAVTGHPPFEGPTPAAIMARHIQESAPPLRSIRRELSEEFCALIKDMMARDRAARPADFGEVVRRFELLRDRGLRPGFGASTVHSLGSDHAWPRVRRSRRIPTKAGLSASDSKEPTDSSDSEKQAYDPESESQKTLMLWSGVGVFLLTFCLLTIHFLRAPAISDRKSALRNPALTPAGPLTAPSPALPADAAPPPAAPQPEVPAVPAVPPVPVDPGTAAVESGQTPEQRVQRLMAELKDLNPSFEGRFTFKASQNQVAELTLNSVGLLRLDPLGRMKDLKSLYLVSSFNQRSPLSDLGPLKGLALVQLTVRYSQVSDLKPLTGMPLEALACDGCPLSDLTVVRSLPLKSLGIRLAKISDLESLRVLKLEALDISGNAGIKDLTPLQGMRLRFLSLASTQVTDLSPLWGMPLDTLHLENCKVGTLAPLKNLPIRRIYLTGAHPNDLNVIRTMALIAIELDYDPQAHVSLLQAIKTLQTINRVPVADFWKSKSR